MEFRERIDAFKRGEGRLSCFGYGKTVAALAARYGRCDIYDDRFDQREPFATNSFNPMPAFDPEASALEVVSPGVPPSNDGVRQAAHLLSDYDFFAPEMPFSIWISGTNGKTTTTQMLQHLLASRGARMGGNVGTPVAELDAAAPIWVLETSSFTLHYTLHATPDIYLLLPVREDHIAWHGSFEAYCEAKLSPLTRMKEGELAVIPKEMAGRVRSDAFVVTYEDAEELAAYFDIDLSRIGLQPPFAMDAVMALAVTRTLYNRVDYDLMGSYRIDPHKLEAITDSRGRLWVDDSKATNTDAVIAGLEGYADTPIHLILGGDDKGADMRPLVDLLKEMDVTAYLIGSNRARLAALCQEAGVRYEECGFLDIAVSRIGAVLKAGEAALLSPAAASLDQFASYKERGEKFQEFIRNLA